MWVPPPFIDCDNASSTVLRLMSGGIGSSASDGTTTGAAIVVSLTANNPLPVLRPSHLGPARIHHQDTKTPSDQILGVLVSWCLGGEISAMPGPARSASKLASPHECRRGRRELRRGR